MLLSLIAKLYSKVYQSSRWLFTKLNYTSCVSIQYILKTFVSENANLESRMVFVCGQYILAPLLRYYLFRNYEIYLRRLLKFTNIFYGELCINLPIP